MELTFLSDPINDDYGVSEDENGNRTYTTEHIAYADSPGMSPWDVMTDPLMPQPHVTVAPWDAAATARKRKPVPYEDDITWFVTIEWSTARIEEKKDADPLLRPVTGVRRCIDVEVPVFIDYRGRPLVNTAGQLYSGQTATASVVVVDVEALFDEFPTFLEELNNTVNAAAVSIHGLTYPGRQCWMKNLRMSDTPEEEYGIEFYRATYEVHIDPRGFWKLLPNSGLTYLEYQTRTGSTDPFKKATKTDYDAAGSSDRQIEEKRLVDSVGSAVAEPSWLDRWGQKTRPTFPNAVIGNASGTAGSKTLTLDTAYFTANDVGLVLTIIKPGPIAKPQQWIVEVVNSDTSVDVHLESHANFSAAPVTASGCLFNMFELQPQADWTALPLPPTPPSL